MRGADQFYDYFDFEKAEVSNVGGMLSVNFIWKRNEMDANQLTICHDAFARRDGNGLEPFFICCEKFSATVI